MARYLITSADERSWKFDRPVLFLGEWCRLYDRKHIWSEMDAVVAKPYGLEPGKKAQDIAYVLKVAEQILQELTEALNTFHQTRHDKRYWNIVLGHWLQRYVSVAFNRFHTLDQAIKNHAVTGTTIFEAKDYSLATTDTLSFNRACNDDQWNHVFYSRLIAYRGDVVSNSAVPPLLGVKGFKDEAKHPTGQRTWYQQLVGLAVHKVAPKLSRNTDAFIITSALPIKEEIKLQLALGQVPQLWRSPSFERFSPESGPRANLMLDFGPYEGFERYIRWQLPEIIPTCYLEGYKSLLKTLERLLWPKKPKFIYTSNNFATDEIFKAWVGEKVEQGIPYFVGQHGNNYGTDLYKGNSNWPERSSADNFFTWGWTNGDSRNIPAFVFTTAGRNPQKEVPEAGGLLLVEACTVNRVYAWDNYFEFGDYQEDQFRFVAALPQAIQKKLMVRLYHGYRNLPWFDEQRWKDRSPHTHIDSGQVNIREATEQSRLVVHSYDSTGILETLSLNIPTMCFWQGGLTHLLTEAKPYYELLRNAGILADSPEHAAELVALYWENVSEWWQSKKVQDARKAFCMQYARTEKHPVSTMKCLLTKACKDVVKKTR